MKRSRGGCGVTKRSSISTTAWAPRSINCANYCFGYGQRGCARRVVPIHRWCSKSPRRRHESDAPTHQRSDPRRLSPGTKVQAASARADTGCHSSGNRRLPARLVAAPCLHASAPHHRSRFPVGFRQAIRSWKAFRAWLRLNRESFPGN